MSTTVIPAVTETESAPVIEQEVSLQERLNAATEEEYKTWERTGEIPAIKPKIEAPPKTEAPAASKETSATAAGESKPPEKVETAPVTEPGSKPQKKRDADGRIAQLLKEQKEERERWESRFAELEGKLPKPQDAGVKTASPTVAAMEKPESAKRPRPKLADNDPKTGKPFLTIADWEDAINQWDEDREKWLTGEIDNRVTKVEQQRAQAEQERRAAEDIYERFAPGRAKYADFDEIVLNPELFLPRGCPADIFVRNSENAAELAYYLGQHPEILQGFYRDPTGKNGKEGVYENVVHPSLQMIELARIEARLTAPVAPAKTSVTTKPLPPPPTVLSAKTSAAGDPVEEAIRKKSFADYEKAANESERRARRA